MRADGDTRAASGPPDGADGGARSYGAGARILTVGIASTGIFSFLYLALASQALPPERYGEISLLWSIAFVILAVIYRPIEQLLSRTIADRRARGLRGHPLRVPALLQAGFALAFLAVALPLRATIQHDLFGGSATLYWILVVTVVAYAGSYFARGWLAGHQRFGAYGGLVLLESVSRCSFAFAAAVGITSGQSAVALGIAVAPFVSLVVVPFGLGRARRRRDAAVARPAAAGHPDGEPQGPADERPDGELTLRHGAGFAIAVFAIMLAEQTLLNAAVLIVAADAGAALAGFVFNVLLIVRAPLQLFQAVQTSILPHLAGLQARAGADEFARAVRVTVLAIAAFAGVCALGLLAIGPWAMETLLGDKGFTYERGGLALVAVGMGFHLAAGTLNQAALARGRAPLAALAWLTVAALFVGWVASAFIADPVLRVEVGYCGGAFLLSCLLLALYRRPA